MGCTNSKPQSNKSVTQNESALAKEGSLKAIPLTAQEIQARIECPNESKPLEIGGLKMKYAWVSQRGYYPDCKFPKLIFIVLF